jgi:hypothetical protein
MSAIILDLDHTLINSVRIPENDTFDKSESCGDNGVELATNRVCFKRPNADVFLRWCFRTFDNIIVWSAGKDYYVNEILDVMFSEFKFDLILTRQHCVGGYQKDFHNPVIKKALRSISIDIKKTLVYFVDDKVHRIQNNHNVKLLHIDRFETKWKGVIEHSKKRKRPIREQDNSLLDVRKKINVL